MSALDLGGQYARSVEDTEDERSEPQNKNGGTGSTKSSSSDEERLAFRNMRVHSEEGEYEILDESESTLKAFIRTFC